MHARFTADVEPEVRELHRDVRGQRTLVDLVEHLEVMVADRGRLGGVLHLLAELREHGSEPVAGERARSAEGIGERLPGHELAHRAVRESALAELLGQPGAARRAQ